MASNNITIVGISLMLSHAFSRIQFLECLTEMWHKIKQKWTMNFTFEYKWQPQFMSLQWSLNGKNKGMHIFHSFTQLLISHHKIWQIWCHWEWESGKGNATRLQSWTYSTKSGRKNYSRVMCKLCVSIVSIYTVIKMLLRSNRMSNDGQSFLY